MTTTRTRRSTPDWVKVNHQTLAYTLAELDASAMAPAGDAPLREVVEAINAAKVGRHGVMDEHAVHANAVEWRHTFGRVVTS
jgi:hypothetical protein